MEEINIIIRINKVYLGLRMCHGLWAKVLGKGFPKAAVPLLGSTPSVGDDVPIRQSSPDDSWIKNILKMVKIDSEIQKHRWTGPARKPWHS